MRTHVKQGMARARRRSPPRPLCRPSVELLEDRSLPSGYAFTPLSFLGDPVPGPGGLDFTFDFEPGEINARGQIAFGADLTIGGEGVFVWDKGEIIPLARTGDPVAEGGPRQYGPIFLGTVTNNDAGEVAFVIHRDGTAFPSLFAQDAGLYRYRNGTVSAALLPGAAEPGGGQFYGVNFRPSINNAGTVAFSALVQTTLGPGSAIERGLGVYTQDKHGHVAKVARPGDAAPGGKTFDYVVNPWINERGDVAFGAHVAEDPCIQFGASFPAGPQLFCAESIYVKSHKGSISAIARQGGPAPGGGTFTYAFGPQINNRGDIAFFGALPVGSPRLVPPDDNTGIFLHSHGTTIAVVRPGDAMPGGGNLVSAGFFTGELGFTNNGTVAFTATLDNDANADGVLDTGLYTWSHGTVSLVARSGTVLPGVGTIQSFHPPAIVGGFPTTFAGAAINERGQIVSQFALTDGRGVMGRFTPHGDPLQAAALGTGAPEDELLTPPQIAPLLEEARQRWQDAGIDTSGLGDIDIAVADLPDAYLGLASAGKIWLDSDAAGWGWFLDPTPGSDDEFQAPAGQGRMDLLTVLVHEMGHLLGYGHADEADDVMAELLSAGVRHMPADHGEAPATLAPFLAADSPDYLHDLYSADLFVALAELSPDFLKKLRS